MKMNTYWRIVLLFALSCAFSWFGIAGNWLWPSAYWPTPIMPLGPLIAAIVTLWFTSGVAGLRIWFYRILRFRAPVWIYAVAFFVPLAIIAASAGLAIAVGMPHRPLPDYTLLEYTIFVPIVVVMGPAPEELAFRGFGQHTLQRHASPLIASLLVGLGVVVWHIPLFAAHEIPSTIAIAIVAVSVVYAWLYNMSRSVWPLVVLHFVQNYFGGGIFGRMFAPDDASIWLGFLGAIYVVWALILVWRFGPGLGRSVGHMARRPASHEDRWPRLSEVRS